MENIELRLFHFIETSTGVKVNRDLLIFEDLGINGTDADSFMEEFSHQFDVDVSGFDPSKFYSSEYELGNIFLTLYRALFQRDKLQKEVFKVSHLIKVIELKKWIDPTDDL